MNLQVGEPLPKFDSPPVVETVLSVQFAQLEGWSAAYVGQYWKEYLDQRWTVVKEVPRLHDQFEKFGAEKEWATSRVRIQETWETPRVQIVTADDQRMIQIQNSRLVQNWRKRAGIYPTYQVLRPEFKELLTGFMHFISERGLGQVAPNQWEVTYVNHLAKDGLWRTPSDWPRIFPGLLIPVGSQSRLTFEGTSQSWSFDIDRDRGRLHIVLQHAQSMADKSELLLLQFVARGTIDEKTDVFEGLDLGHEVVVRKFEEMTSEEAHEYWRRAS